MLLTNIRLALARSQEGRAMTPAARLSAAIEVLADIETRRRPAADALKDWGLAHRFAGSGDRAAIAGLALRRAAPQGVGGLRHGRRHAARGAARHAAARAQARCSPRSRKLADGGRFAPPPLTDAERARLDAASLDGAPPWVAGDYPEWLDPQFAADLRRRARRGRRGAGVARAARSARQHAQGDARGGGSRRSPILRPRRRAGRRTACASCSPPMPAARRSMPSRPSSRA